MAKKYYRYNDEKGQVEWVGGDNFFEPLTDELALKADKTELFSGSYNDLTNKPSIPSQTDVNMGVTAYGWGDHASEGYAKTKADVGLGNVDNTSDVNKPISSATQTALNDKVDKVSGKALSTNDFTNALKTKLEGVAEGATNTAAPVNADWSATTGLAQIKNKPALGSAASRDVGIEVGNVMEVGAGGVLRRLNIGNAPMVYEVAGDGFAAGYHDQSAQGIADRPINSAGTVFVGPTQSGTGSRREVIWLERGGYRIFVGSSPSDGNTTWQEIYHTGNIRKSTGNNDNYPMSQKAVTDALNSAPGLGVGQTWQDVKSSRVKGTTYTNTTGKPISVVVEVFGEMQVQGNLFVDDLLVVSQILPTGADDNYLSFSVIVPAGSTYMFETWDTSISVYRWTELR